MKEIRKATTAVAATASLVVTSFAVSIGLALGLAPAFGGDAAMAGAGKQIIAQAAPAPDAAAASARRRAHQRPPTRIRVHPRYRADDVYPRYDPGPDAVRDCTATYVQEFRPSGTVIVPRMNCVWRHG
ncbi:MAG: hypothetical protein M9932_15815 [Xanthobacteraceae bacterium]|nr:hypothetical protein [Xanthobacteraceae bacterium]